MSSADMGSASMSNFGISSWQPEDNINKIGKVCENSINQIQKQDDKLAENSSEELSQDEIDELAKQLEEFFTKYIVLENGSFVVKEDTIIADGYGDHIEDFRNAAKGLNLSMEDQQ
ncbi:hypothetical protein [Gardnerella vaginalis]|uniref:hypothetical protein n=1 Tax=Gardnerella vaginalis TaxID=2702 RepID=UPI0039EFFA99